MQGEAPELRILSLEDVAYDAELMERELRKDGIAYRLMRVETRQQFLDAVEEFKPDIILADYSLPQFSALEALRLLKGKERNVPVILVTGSHSEEAAVECMKEGAEDYILKASLTRLPSALKNTLRKRSVELTKEAAESALRQSELQFRIIAENTRDLICLLDENDSFVYASPSYEIVLGLKWEALGGSSFFDHIHHDDLARARRMLEQVRQQRQQRTAELRYKDSHSHWRIFEAAASLPADTNGKPTRLVIVARDISERKRAEQEIQHLATFPRFNPNPVLAFDADGVLTYFNEAAAAMARLFGKEHPRAILPEDTAKVVRKCLASRHNFIRIDSIIGPRTISWTFYPIKATQSVHCYAEDITDRLSLETQLRRSQKMESVGQVAAGIAHDFNNILTIVQGYASLLLQDESVTGKGRHGLEQISTASQRGANLTRQLLLFSRKQLAQPQVLDLNSIIRETAKMLKVLLGEQIELTLELDEPLPAVNADEGMIEQVLMNLTVNSRDAMPRGGRITLCTALRSIDERYARQRRDARPGDFVCLAVIDRGTGMSPETLSHMFEPFFTTKEVGKGTGLGLATVYAIVKQHHGWIDVHTREGEGTTFTLFFPASKDVPAEVTRPIPSNDLPRGSETILVVEDEEPLRALVRSILHRAGYTVLEAASGHEALNVWQEHRGEVDLLLTDIMMPEGMSGYDLAEKLQADEPSLRVLYTSGYPVDVLESSQPRHEMCFLQKPYQPALLAQAVRECLERTGRQRRSTARRTAAVH